MWSTRRSSGMIVFVCSNKCRWRMQMAWPKLKGVEWGKRRPHISSCYFCAACGSRVSDECIEWCMIHELDGCPDWDWFYSLSAIDFARVYKHHTEQAPSDEAWEVAHDMAIVDRTLSGAIIAAAVIQGL
jgi:hypothetical protein